MMMSVRALFALHASLSWAAEQTRQGTREVRCVPCVTPVLDGHNHTQRAYRNGFTRYYGPESMLTEPVEKGHDADAPLACSAGTVIARICWR